MLTAAIEEYRDVIEDLKVLFPAHHKEVGIYQDRMPLSPRYELYAERDAAGELVMPIVRKDGEIVGYWPTFVAPGMHYSTTLTATMDILWVHPEHRGEGAGKMLAECLARELKRRGVKLWWAGSKNHKDIEEFLLLLGFQPTETYFSRWIGD